jgi:hypothetical protein
MMGIWIPLFKVRVFIRSPWFQCIANAALTGKECSKGYQALALKVKHLNGIMDNERMRNTHDPL